ncbi:hypothetical protein IJ096_03610, partial [Candidatus Saccharibacteria bacterium]|nr:hypothetical protein [Candidatus Saccharibacteria bacterium]
MGVNHKKTHTHKASRRSGLGYITNILSSKIKYLTTPTSQAQSSKLTIHNNFYFSPRYYRYFTLGIFTFLLAFISSA